MSDGRGGPAPLLDAGQTDLSGQEEDRRVGDLEALLDRQRSLGGELAVLAEDIFRHHRVPGLHRGGFAYETVVC